MLVLSGTKIPEVIISLLLGSCS